MHIVELIIDLMLQLKIGNHFRSAVTLQGPFADVKEVAQVLVVQQMLTLFLMRSVHPHQSYARSTPILCPVC